LIAAVDLNHDGVLETAEIEKASEALRKLDKNGDGSVTADELRAPRTSRPRSTPAEAGTGETTQLPPTRSRLGALAANRDGMIDESEIGAASQVLAKLDKDRDGKVTLEEVRSYRAPRSNAPRPSVETAKE
jgi:Ca2+-binding EF-hand superfamily protein